MGYTRQPVHDIISILRYYTETVIQIFKRYTKTHMRCYIGIISCIQTDSHRMNKREYGLHVFIGPYTMIHKKVIQKGVQQYFVLYSPVFCPNTGENDVKITRIHGDFM